MNAAHEDIREEVDLPDPEVQRLVHPLDLPQARAQFRTAWLIGALTSVPVAALVAAIVAYATRSPGPPIIVFFALAVIGALASRWHRERSWDYIPRKRQDRDRPLPRVWDVVSSGVLALVFGIALLLIVFRLDDGDVSAEALSFTFGMGAVAALLVVGDTVIGLIRPIGRARTLGRSPRSRGGHRRHRPGLGDVVRRRRGHHHAVLGSGQHGRGRCARRCRQALGPPPQPLTYRRLPNAAVPQFTAFPYGGHALTPRPGVATMGTCSGVRD
jgi:hypothetical protein